MKKLPIILVALAAAAALTLSGCQNSKTQGEKKENANGKQEQTADYGDDMSLQDAESKLAEEEPKGDLDKEILVTVDDVPFSAAEVKLAISNHFSSGSDGTEENTSKTVEQDIEDTCRIDAALIKFSQQYGAGISNDNYASVVTNQIENLKSQYGDDYANIVETYTGCTPYLYFNYQLYNVAYSGLFDKLYGEDTNKEKFQTMHDETLKELQDNDYVCAKHILITFPEDIAKDENGNITDEAKKAETLAKAQAVLERVKNGEDFDALIKECGEDPGMQQQPDGYCFKKGDMVEPFETATYALEVGGVSDIVETSYGYHIIKRIELDSPALKNSDVYQSKYNAYQQEVGQELYSKLEEAGKGYKVTYDDSFKTRVEELTKEFKDKQAAQNAETPDTSAQTDADAGTDTSDTSAAE